MGSELAWPPGAELLFDIQGAIWLAAALLLECD